MDRRPGAMPGLPRSCRWLMLVAVAGLMTRTVGAQAGRAEQAGSVAPPARRTLPSAASLPVGARLRLTLVDQSILFGPNEWRADAAGHVQASFLALEPTTVHVLLSSGDTITFPSTSIRMLEVSNGPGLCHTSDAATVACDVGAVLGAALVGTWAGDKVARQLQEEEPDRRNWRWRGGIVAGLLTLSFVPLIGRDRWIQVGDWPAVDAR